MADEPTPAERAGAASLETSPTHPAISGAPDVSRRSSSPPEGIDDSDLELQVIRRRRRRRSGKAWFIGAALLGLGGMSILGSAFGLEKTIDPASGFEARKFLTTPLASVRRIPEFLAEPVAARNLTAALAPTLAQAPTGTCVQFTDASRPVASHNPSLPLTPASNLKIVTAVAALELLGSDTRLQTRFMTDGKPTDGSTVKGNLYMVGGGDPLLTSDRYAGQLRFPDQPATDLETVADKIVATGIRRVTGSVVGDASRYDDVQGPDSWPNRYFTQGQVGPLSALMVDDGWTVGVGPTRDPAQHAAAVMTSLLTARGVTIDGPPIAGVTPAEASELVEIPSLSIGELVSQALSFSDNTTSELLLKEIGRTKGSGGSTTAGVQAVMSWAETESLPIEGVTMIDGSGLSPENRLTCAFLSEVLAIPGPDSIIASGLAVPGKPGTLHDRFLKPPLRDSLRAKTGTLNGVTSLSGWLNTTAGVPLDFSIIINVEGRGVSAGDLGLQTDVLTAGLTYPESPAPDTLIPEPVRSLG